MSLTRPLENVPTEEIIMELESRHLLDDELESCLECGEPIKISKIKVGNQRVYNLGEIVTCKNGHKMKITLSWMLETMHIR